MDASERSDTRRLLFKVKRRSDEHEYRIYDDGSIEGFSPGSMVLNRYPILVGYERLQWESERRLNASASPTSNAVSDLGGLEQGSAIQREKIVSEIAAASGEK